MKAVTLNKTDKDHIFYSLIDKSQAAATLAAYKAENEDGLAKKVIQEWMGEHYETYQSLPPEFQTRGRRITLNNFPRETGERYGTDLAFSELHAFPDAGYNKFIDASDFSEELIDELTVYFKRVDELDEQHNSFKGNVRQILDSCRSTKQLLEAMPEAEGYIPESVKAKMRNSAMPAVASTTIDAVRSNLVPETAVVAA